MNKLTIIGNLTKKPELRTTSAGVNVCDFTVAVNRRNRNKESGQQDADFFRVTAWRERGELCAKWLDKGSKVCVIGPVSVRAYQAQDGSARASLEVTADEVEFLNRANGEQTEAHAAPSAPVDAQSGMAVVEKDELEDFPY